MGSFTLTQFEMIDVQTHLAQVPDEDAKHPVERSKDEDDILKVDHDEAD